MTATLATSAPKVAVSVCTAGTAASGAAALKLSELVDTSVRLEASSSPPPEHAESRKANKTPARRHITSRGCTYSTVEIAANGRRVVADSPMEKAQGSRANCLFTRTVNQPAPVGQGAAAAILTQAIQG